MFISVLSKNSSIKYLLSFTAFFAEKALKVAENRAKSVYFRKQARSRNGQRSRVSRAGGDTTHRQPANRHRHGAGTEPATTEAAHI